MTPTSDAPPDAPSAAPAPVPAAPAAPDAVASPASVVMAAVHPQEAPNDAGAAPSMAETSDGPTPSTAAETTPSTALAPADGASASTATATPAATATPSVPPSTAAPTASETPAKPQPALSPPAATTTSTSTITPSQTPATSSVPAASAAPPSASTPTHAAATTATKPTTVAAAAVVAEPEPPAVLVPRCSTWFDLSAVNPIEKRMLPEFFPPAATSGGVSKTPQLYVKYRNYMVAAYRQQPGVYLTATACRRSLAGDACAIMRVHEFLTHWGIINFDVPPHAMPPALNPNYALRSVRAPSSRDTEAQPVAMLVDSSSSSSGSAPHFRCELCARVCKGDGDFFELSAEAKRHATTGGNASNNGDAQSTVANSTGAAVSNGKMAPGSDGVFTVGAFAVAPGSGICEECFLTHSYPEQLDAGDFVRVTAGPSDSKWTQEELDRLLDAVSASSSTRRGASDGHKSGDTSCDWNFVAAKVGTKTPEQCLLHFLELPLLNGTVGGAGIHFPPTAARSNRSMTPAGALNAPVLELVELVAQVDPLVAKAAARAAVAAVKELHTMPVARDGVKDEGGSSSLENRPTSIDNAAQAIVDSAVDAGVAVKTEPVTVEADGDVVMTDGSADGTDKQEPAPIKVTKETLAVLEEAASATTVAMVATRAHAIADETARGPMRELVDQLVENQLQQMELKMKQLGVLEATLAAERDQLARERHELYMERLAFAQEKLNVKPMAAAQL